MYRIKSLARYGNRARIVGKAKNVRRYANPSASLRSRASYVLASPELGDFSYDLHDHGFYANFLAGAFGAPASEYLGYLNEIAGDDVLARDYREQRRASLTPRRPGLAQRMLWYAIIRQSAPRLVVEAGAWYGLGSLVILRALERNREDNRARPGSLVSIDADPSQGWLVPPRFDSDPIYRHVAGYTTDVLEPLLADSDGVDVFINDVSTTTAEPERVEYETALRYARPGAVLISANGDNTSALADFCRDHATVFHHTDLIAPEGHWFAGDTMSMTIVGRDAKTRNMVDHPKGV